MQSDFFELDTKVKDKIFLLPPPHCYNLLNTKELHTDYWLVIYNSPTKIQIVKHKAILVLGAFVLGNGQEFFIFSKEAGAGVPTNPTIDSRFRENEGRWCRNEGGDMEIRAVV